MDAVLERRWEEADDIRLLEKVIDIEVQNHTPSPTVDPSVRAILIGHSVSSGKARCLPSARCSMVFRY